MPKVKDQYRASKNTTLALVVFATLIAIYAKASIFNLVLFSWSGLGISLGAAAVIKLCNIPLKEMTTIVVVLLSGGVTILWRLFMLHNGVSEALPGALTFIVILSTIKLFNIVYSKEVSTKNIH